MTKTAVAVAMAGLLAASFAAAVELAPNSGGSVRLGHVTGSVYYTVEQDGYRVVTTISQGDVGLATRFVATLNEGQILTISIPGNMGEASQALDIARVNGVLVIGETPKTGELVSARPPLASESE